MGRDYSRQTAVIYIDKAVRGEVASCMVMDADLGGRSEREREEGKQEKRRKKIKEINTHTKNQMHIYDFFVLQYWKNIEHPQGWDI